MATTESGKPGERLVSLDAYRGFVMLAMASGGLSLAAVGQYHPDSQFWSFLHHHTDHVPWRGCSAWDLIQPSFMFIVGVAMPFSYANRRAAGQSRLELFRHALVRSAVLVLLAIFLTSSSSSRTSFVFTNVLAQIGLGYPVVYLLLGRRPTTQFAAACAVLAGNWLLFTLYPLPDPESPYRPVGIDEVFCRMPGFLHHWTRGTNAAAAFDRWFLNLFPQADGRPFRQNDGGYTTLNFVPSIATMLSGVLAGEWLRTDRTPVVKLQGLLIVGALTLALGTAMDETVCPIVKRIWTPAWVLYSTGWTCWLLMIFYGVVDVLGYRRWAFPFVVVGLNSIAMYVMAQLMKPFVRDTLRTHLGRNAFEWLYGPILLSALVLLMFWLVCLWMYRRRIFLRI